MQGDEEIYIQGVSGAIVRNPDTIHDEVTTQAFSGAIVGKCSQNLLDHYNLAYTENAPELRYRTRANSELVSR